VFYSETHQNIKWRTGEIQPSYDSSTSSNGEDDQPSPKKLKPDCKTSSAVCYICQLTSLPGKFFPKKAIELGVPKGPLFGDLQSGKTVTLQDGRQVGLNSSFLCWMCDSFNYNSGKNQAGNVTSNGLHIEVIY